MKKLMTIFAASVLTLSSTLGLVACKSKNDAIWEITLQNVVKKDGTSSTSDYTKIYDEVINKIKQENKNDSELSKFKFKYIDSDADSKMQDLLEKNSVPVTDKSIPDIMRVYYNKKNLVDQGVFLPLDKDNDQETKSWLKDIGLTEETVDKENNFSKAGYDRVRYKQKGTSQFNTYMIPSAFSTASGFFYKKDPESLKLYDSLKLGKIVDKDNNEIDATSVDNTNYQNYRFDFGHGEKYGYLPWNKLVKAAQVIANKSINDSNKANVNLFTMGISVEFMLDFGMGQIHYEGKDNIRSKVVGKSWKNADNAYLDELTEIQKAQANLKDGENLSELLKNPNLQGKWETILNHPKFEKSAKNYFGKLFDYAIQEGRFAKSNDWGQDKKFETYFDRKNASDDVIIDSFQNYLLTGSNVDGEKGNITNHNSSVDGKMWMLNSFGQSFAAYRMGLTNGVIQGDENKTDANKKTFEQAYKNLDFAPIYKIGTGVGELTDGDLNDPDSWYDNSNPNSNRNEINGWTNGIGGSAFGVNNRISKDSNYKSKIKVIRQFFKHLVNDYMRNEQNGGVKRWYTEANMISPIVGKSKYLEDHKNELFADSKERPEFTRLKLADLTGVSHLQDQQLEFTNDPNKKMWVESSASFNNKQFNDEEFSKPLSSAWSEIALGSKSNLLSKDAIFEGKKVWDQIIGLMTESNGEIKDKDAYKKLREKFITEFINHINSLISSVS